MTVLTRHVLVSYCCCNFVKISSVFGLENNSFSHLVQAGGSIHSQRFLQKKATSDTMMAVHEEIIFIYNLKRGYLIYV